MNKQHWQDWLTAVVGVWLVVSPWVLTFAMPEGASTTVIDWNFVLSGTVAVMLGVAALASYRFWEEWADMALGLWLVASPWVLQFTASSAGKWNAIACGIIVIAAAGWTLIEEQQTRRAA